MRHVAALVAFLAGAPAAGAAASIGPDWGKDGYFKLTWSFQPKNSLEGVDVARARREVWAVSSQGYDGSRHRLDVLDASGKNVRQADIKTRLDKFRVWDTGEKFPLLAVMDALNLSAFEARGRKLWSVALPQCGPVDCAVMPPASGHPLLAAACSHGDAGVRAFDERGRLAWESSEAPRGGWIGAESLGGRGLFVVRGGIGKFYLLDGRGAIVEEILAGGHEDRAMFAGERTMYGLDSGNGAWKETLTLFSADPQAKAARWSAAGRADLGPITATAFALGDFDGNGRRQPVIGSGNGWVFLLDETGAKVSEARFRGRIGFLGALDLDGDGKDELVVSVEGFPGRVLAFSRR